MGETDKETERERDRQRQRYFTQSGASVYRCERAQGRRVPVRACGQQTLILSVCDCKKGRDRDRQGQRQRQTGPG